MLHFPFKQRLGIILATCIVFLGIGIPAATFAASRHSEQRLSTSLSHAVRNSTAGTPIPITTDCSSPSLQVIATISKGDQVQGSAILTSSDPNEASESENLHLQEQNSQFTKPITTVTINNSPQNFFFVAGTFNDTLTACVDGIDSDDTATVSVTITAFPKPDFAQTVVCERSAQLKPGEKRECSLAMETIPQQVVGCTGEIGETALKDIAIAAGHPEVAAAIEELAGLKNLADFVRAKTNLERVVKLLGFVLPTECITGLADVLTHGQFSALGICLADKGCTLLIEKKLHLK